MGEVYLATDLDLDRPVALKFLPPWLSQDKIARDRFIMEAKTASKLSHPNIVTIYAVDAFQGKDFIVMEFVDGEPLKSTISRAELSFSRIIEIGIQICDGLSKAHKAGVVHRDIKPQNILLDRDGGARICDFGLAKSKEGPQLTMAGSTVGTISYMSPEQAQGQEIDHRSDIFSFGAVLYEMITGKAPFEGNNEGATIDAIIRRTPEPLERYKSGVEPELQRIVTKSLAKNRAERYQSAADIAADLRALNRTLDLKMGDFTNQDVVSRPSIAVLPFANMSSDPENEYFSDGLTEELLNVLARNPELRVTGRTSSFAFKGKREDMREIGQKLGVGTLLEGSVRKAGNRVRITAQLVNVADGFHLWSETYDRVLDDIFAVQDEISKAVAAAMNVTLLAQPAKIRVTNPESYELTLRAQQSALQMTGSSMGVAVDLFHKAIDLDPNSARAWAGLAMAHAVQVAYGHIIYDEGYPLAKNAAKKAIALDKDFPHAHHAMGYIDGALELRIEEAGIEFRKAYFLAPNDSRIVSSLSIFEAFLGHFEEAFRLSNLAIELDPLNPSAFLDRGRILMYADKLDEASQAFQKALEISPDIITAHASLGAVARRQGRFDDALMEANKELSAGYRNCELAIDYFALGRNEDSDRALTELLSRGPQWAFQFACVYAYRGMNDKAFECLEKGLACHDAGIMQTRVVPTFRNLQSDPRWPIFLKKIGLAG